MVDTAIVGAGDAVATSGGPGGAHPGAIVIGGDYQGLGIVRSLGRRGVSVLILDDERSISRWSRFASGAVRVPSLRTDEDALTALSQVARTHDVRGWLVFATREETVAALAKHRDELLGQFRIATPPWDVTRWAWDKRNTYARAAELGIATPRTWHVSSAADLELVDGDPPFVIKPAIKERFIYATGAKAWRADTRSELRLRFGEAAKLIGSDEVMIQELVPGSGECQLAYCALFKNGRSLASMTVRRLRQHPVEFGRASTFVETIDCPELQQTSDRFLRSIGYYGLAELEYKYDHRDGRTKLLDVNARTWGYHSLGQAAGVDFPYLLYVDQVQSAKGAQSEVAEEPVRARTGVTWVRLATDIPTAATELARRRMRVRDYVASLRSADTEAVFDRGDPLPSLSELSLLPYLALKRGF